MSSLDVEDAATAYALAKSGFFVTNKYHSIMKQYIIMKHSDGLFVSVAAQFDNPDEAEQFAKLASKGTERWTYEVFERHQ